MDEFEGTFEGLVDQMFQVIFDLLGTLNIEDDGQDAAETIHLTSRYCLLVLHLLLDQSQVPAHTAHTRVQFHAPIHLEQCILVGSHSHIHQGRVSGTQFLAEAVEEPIVGRQFS